MILLTVAAANPPLPPNSTRGLTPGLINPALGNVPGNVIPHPALPDGGRLRVGLGRRRGPQAVPLLVTVAAPAAPPPPPASTPANAPPAPMNPPLAPLSLNTRGRNANTRDSQRTDNLADTKRRRSSRGGKGRPSQRQARDSNDSGEDNEMGTESEANETFMV